MQSTTLPFASSVSCTYWFFANCFRSEGFLADLEVGTGICRGLLGPICRFDAVHHFALRLERFVHILVLRKLLQAPIAAISNGGLHSLTPHPERLTEGKGWIDVVCIGRGNIDDRAGHKAF